MFFFYLFVFVYLFLYTVKLLKRVSLSYELINNIYFCISGSQGAAATCQHKTMPLAFAVVAELLPHRPPRCCGLEQGTLK